MQSFWHTFQGAVEKVIEPGVVGAVHLDPGLHSVIPPGFSEGRH